MVKRDTIICAETGSELTVTPGASYSWSSGDTSQILYVTNPGVYSVTVTDNNGCLSYATKTVSDMEQVTISGNTTICSGKSTIVLCPIIIRYGKTYLPNAS